MSDIAILKQKAGEVANSLGHSRDPNIILLYLVEELGEVVRAFLKETGHKSTNDRITESSKHEIGDVFFLLLRLAHVTDTDLEKELNNTINKVQKAKHKHITDRVSLKQQ